MGFGHRVYKNFDPRAKIIRAMCHKVLAALGRSDNPLFELALRLEEIALKDDYFIARTVGWVAHWQEMISDPAMRIGRPRQLYTGATRRDYVAMSQRS
jgi:citrate synthase